MTKNDFIIYDQAYQKEALPTGSHRLSAMGEASVGPGLGQ